MGLCVFFLVGPTATGKSDVALRIAAGGGWSILSADSMMVYRGMDIGTAKPPAESLDRIPHDGIDLVEPSSSFSAGAFRRYAVEAVARRVSAGNRVMVVGGTGLYVKALACGLGAPASDPVVRATFQKRVDAEGVDALARELKRIAPEVHAAVDDLRNPRRVIRAMEIASGRASGGAKRNASWSGGVAVGLMVDPAELRKRIATRAEAMFNGGLLDEVRRLLAGGELSETARGGIGYAEAIACLAGRCTKMEAVEKTTLRTCQLAKRQRTWFRHQMPVKWIDATVPDTERIAAAVQAAWRENGPTAIFEGE